MPVGTAQTGFVALTACTVNNVMGNFVGIGYDASGKLQQSWPPFARGAVAGDTAAEKGGRGMTFQQRVTKFRDWYPRVADRRAKAIEEDRGSRASCKAHFET